MKRVLVTVVTVLMCFMMPVMVAAAGAAVGLTPMDEENVVTIATNGKTTDGLLEITYDENELSIKEEDILLCEGVDIMYSVNVDEKGVIKISYLAEKTIEPGAFMTLNFEKLPEVEEVKSVVKITGGEAFDKKGNELSVIASAGGSSSGGGSWEETPETSTEENKPVTPPSQSSSSNKVDETVNSEAADTETTESLGPVEETDEEKTETPVETETVESTEAVETTEAAEDVTASAGGSNNMVLVGIILVIIVVAVVVVVYMKKMKK